jgi:hypothetical protein
VSEDNHAGYIDSLAELPCIPEVKNGGTENIFHKCLHFFHTSIMNLLQWSLTGFCKLSPGLLFLCSAWLISFSFYQENGVPQRSVLSLPHFVVTATWMQ